MYRDPCSRYRSSVWVPDNAENKKSLYSGALILGFSKKSLYSGELITGFNKESLYSGALESLYSGELIMGFGPNL